MCVALFVVSTPPAVQGRLMICVFLLAQVIVDAVALMQTFGISDKPFKHALVDQVQVCTSLH